MSRPQGGNRRGAWVVAVVLLLTAASWGTAMAASAQESPTPTETPSPSDSPSPSESPSATESPSPTESPDPTPTQDPTFSPSPSPPPGAPSYGSTGSVVPSDLYRGLNARGIPSREDLLSHADGGRRHRHRDWRDWAPDPRWGDYGTARLDRAAVKLRRKGWSEERIASAVYTPFIVEGPATWSDSWGAPRWVGGYHPHHGQDVLCSYGAPVLAVDRGEIVYGTDALGGRVAYLTRSDGSFWYYAHLKSYAKDLSSHDRVRPGRVIGYCGASGDATVPHVHFCFFDAGHQAVDPMPALVAWLAVAERRLGDAHRRPAPLPDPASLLRPLHPVLDHATDEPGLIEASAPAEPIPPKARALGVAAVLFLAGASMGAGGRRRKGPDDEETGSPAQAG